MQFLLQEETTPILYARSCLVPEQVAAKDEAEHEDEEANAQDDDIDVERQVEELFRCHLAVGVDVLQSKVTQTP